MKDLHFFLVLCALAVGDALGRTVLPGGAVIGDLSVGALDRIQKTDVNYKRYTELKPPKKVLQSSPDMLDHPISAAFHEDKFWNQQYIPKQDLLYSFLAESSMKADLDLDLDLELEEQAPGSTGKVSSETDSTMHRVLHKKKKKSHKKHSKKHFDPIFQGDSLPWAVSFKTTKGQLTIDPKNVTYNENGDPISYVFICHSARSEFQTNIWDYFSVPKLALNSPDNVHYVFASYGYGYVGANKDSYDRAQSEYFVKDLEERVLGSLTFDENGAFSAGAGDQIFENVVDDAESDMDLDDYYYLDDVEFGEEFTQDDLDKWADRFHFVTEPLLEKKSWFRDQILTADNWAQEGNLLELNISFANQPDKDSPVSDIYFSLGAMLSAGKGALLTETATQTGWGPDLFDKDGKSTWPEKANLVYFGTGCDEALLLSPNYLKGKVAVVERGNCSLASQTWNVQSHGALALIVVSSETEFIHKLQCQEPDECEKMVIPAIEIPNFQGNAIRDIMWADPAIGITINTKLHSIKNAPWVFGIDCLSRMRHIGLPITADLQFAAFEAQNYNYQWTMIKQRRAKFGHEGSQYCESMSEVANHCSIPNDKTGATNNTMLTAISKKPEDSFLEVKIFDNQYFATHAVKQIKFKNLEKIKNLKFNKMEVDFAIKCQDVRTPGVSDELECGAWDYMLSLVVMNSPTEKGALFDEFVYQDTTPELARWISAYGRPGKWVTDVSTSLPFIIQKVHEGKPLTLGLSSTGSIHANVDMTIRMYYSKDPDFFGTDGPSGDEVESPKALLRIKDKAASVPVQTLQLFSGGFFNDLYNNNSVYLRTGNFKLENGSKIKKATLTALITGHGFGDDNDCAEFCDHHHHFTVNDKEFIKTFPLAGTETGCTSSIADGTVPNQFGTWFYGRSGWCPGSSVKPWVMDITHKLKFNKKKDTASVAVKYHASFKGNDTYLAIPNDGVMNARIKLSSFLTIYN